MVKKTKEIKQLTEFGTELVQQIEKGKNPTIHLSVRSLSNVEFDKKTQKIQMGEKMAERQFFNVAHARKFLQTIEVAAISKQLLEADKHASLRDVFYMAKRTIPGTHVNVVDDQKESDKAIEDLEVILDMARERMHVNANKMGSVAGKVIIEDKGDTIDWSKLGSGGWSIPSNVEEIEFKKVSAKYIIYMEKAAIWERLHEDRFWDKQNCIIMSSQGQTTRGIRRLLQRLVTEHKLPVFVLADNDPYGFYIYSVIKFGSITLAHMSDTMAIPDVRFIGITCDDVEHYNLKRHYIKMTEQDISRLKQMQEYDWFKNNKAWMRQFNMMMKAGAKVEIQALSSRGITFISDTYLPEKIKKNELID